MTFNNNLVRFCSLRQNYTMLDLDDYRSIFTSIHDFLISNYSKSFDYCHPDFHLMKCNNCDMINCCCDEDVVKDWLPVFQCILCNYEIIHPENKSE